LVYIQVRKVHIQLQEFDMREENGRELEEEDD
jgi:hypothetical protein